MTGLHIYRYLRRILDLYVPFCYFADYQHTQHTLVVQLQLRQAQTLLTSYPGITNLNFESTVENELTVTSSDQLCNLYVIRRQQKVLLFYDATGKGVLRPAKARSGSLRLAQ